MLRAQQRPKRAVEREKKKEERKSSSRVREEGEICGGHQQSWRSERDRGGVEAAGATKKVMYEKLDVVNSR